MIARAPARAGAAALLLLLLYVLAGEVLGAWVGLYFDAWGERERFGSARDQQEWQQVERGLDAGLRFWPWKSSLHLDAARLQLHALRGGFRDEHEVGRAVVARVADVPGHQDGERVALRLRGHLLLGDAGAAAEQVRQLREIAPYTREHWHLLAPFAANRALDAPALRPVARDIIAWYAGWDAPALRVMARRSIAVSAFLPADFPRTPARDDAGTAPAAAATPSR